MIRRGDLVWVDFDPARASEADKRRRAVVVSNDGANRTATRLRRGVVTVVPVTSNVRRVYPFQVMLAADRCGLDVDSKAQSEQIRSVSLERIGSVIGRVPRDLLDDLDRSIRLHLAL